MVGRPGVDDCGQHASPGVEKLRRQGVHRQAGQQQTCGQRPFQGAGKACAQAVEDQPGVIAKRRVEVEHGKAVAEAFISQPARAGIAAALRQVQVEEAKEVVRTVIGLLQARLPQGLQGRQGQQDDQQERQECAHAA